MIKRAWSGYRGSGTRMGVKRVVIGDDLYHIAGEMLGCIQGGNQGVMVVRNDARRP